MAAFIIIIVFLVGFGIFYARQHRIRKPDAAFSPAWRSILLEKVNFYVNLQPDDRLRFEDDIMRFLANVRITGVETEIDITDKLLVASSAAIPVFGFPEWNYTFLDEVLIYPGSFDRNYEINSHRETITGMVGSGTMEGKMILSRPALHRGFDNATDKQNVGIHEFIHLLDKEDGNIDGVPTILHNRQYALPWLDLIRSKTRDIMKGGSDINDYGSTSNTEFLAVAGEYFFERPQLLQKNHPELYDLLRQAFMQDTASTLKAGVKREKVERNDPCPCGSGEKYKVCCMNKVS